MDIILPAKVEAAGNRFRVLNANLSVVCTTADAETAETLAAVLNAWPYLEGLARCRDAIAEGGESGRFQLYDTMEFMGWDRSVSVKTFLNRVAGKAIRMMADLDEWSIHYPWRSDDDSAEFNAETEPPSTVAEASDAPAT